MSYSNTKYYVESIIVATILSDNQFIIKNAQSGVSDVISGLVSAVKNYVSGKIDADNKLGSIFNILAPGMLAALGGSFSVLGGLLWIAEEFFGFEPDKILEEIVHGLTDSLKNGTVTPEQVDDAANHAVLNNYGGPPSEADLLKVTGTLTLRDAQIYKIALAHVLSNISISDIGKKLSIQKRADISSLLLKFLGVKHTTASILSRVIGWIVKTVLISAGFMSAGALWDHMTNKNTESAAPALEAPAPPQTTQQTFKVNPTYAQET